LEKIRGQVLSRLSYYERTLETCKGYIVSSSRISRPLKCMKCGKIFASPGEGAAKCPSCYSEYVEEATPQDIASYADQYCWALYGSYISYLRGVMNTVEKLCTGGFECDFLESTSELSIHVDKYRRFVRLELEANRQSIRGVVRGANYQVLDLINSISKALLEKRELLISGGIKFVYYITTYDETEVGHETLIREGFLDYQYYNAYLGSLGYSVSGYTGAVVKILDLRKGSYIAPA